MRKNKTPYLNTGINLYLAIFIIAVIAATAFLYLKTQEKNEFGFFPEKLGDMSIALYRDGDIAMTEVKSLHRGLNVEIENAYIANYKGGNNKAKFWVSTSKTNEEAASLLAAMNGRVGKTGMFSDSTPVSMEGIMVYFVTGLGEYHYFYAKEKRVFWIQINNPDREYQLGIVKESIKRI